MPLRAGNVLYLFISASAGQLLLRLWMIIGPGHTGNGLFLLKKEKRKRTLDQ